jgi:hypothetical protein
MMGLLKAMKTRQGLNHCPGERALSVLPKAVFFSPLSNHGVVRRRRRCPTTLRGAKAGNDDAQCAPNQGWNEFLAKITQNNQGCGVCIRIRAADGNPIEGLKFAPQCPAGP